MYDTLNWTQGLVVLYAFVFQEQGGGTQSCRVFCPPRQKMLSAGVLVPAPQDWVPTPLGVLEDGD